LALGYGDGILSALSRSERSRGGARLCGRQSRSNTSEGRSAADVAYESDVTLRARLVPRAARDAPLLGSGVTAVLTGVLLWGLWRWAGYPLGVFSPGLDGHGPDPYAWPRLLVLWVPLGHVLFALAYLVLERWDRRGTLRRFRLADQLCLGLVPVLGAGLLLAGPDGRWRLLVGAWFTLFVGLKAAIFARALWCWLESDDVPLGRASVGIFLGAFLPYLLLGAHVTTAMSTTSDEPYYLLVAHSLLHDRDLDLANNVAARDYLPFYWGDLPRVRRAIQQTADGRMYSRLYQGFQPVLLMPGYAAAGRPGAVVTLNVLGAGAMLLAYGFARASGASPRAAFLAWLGAAFSVPLVIFSASPFPEISGAFFAAAAAYALWQSPPTWTLAVTAAISLAGMVAVKTRLFLMLPPLLLGYARRLTWRTGAAVVGTLVATGVAAAVYDATFFSGHIRFMARGQGILAELRWGLAWLVKAPTEYRGHLGLLLDQEFGLLPTAPVFALAVAGMVVAAAQRRWRLLLLTAGPFLCTWYLLGAATLAGISAERMSQWYAGFSPPGRFLTASLPLMTVLIALAVDHVRGRIAWTVVAALYAGTFGYAAALSVWPAWRFQDAVGRAVVLIGVFRHAGLDPGRFLPSFIMPSAHWAAVGVAILAGLLVGGYALSRRPGTLAPRGAWLAGAGTAVACVAALFALAWLAPAGAYPAILGAGRGGTNYWGMLRVSAGSDVGIRERLVWATQRDSVLELAPRLPPGRYGIVVRAGAQATDGAPALLVRLGAAPSLDVPLESAPPPTWREHDYVAEVTWGGGRLPIRVELDRISRLKPVRLAYVDAIEIRRLAP
jgi:hypothetical protein